MPEGSFARPLGVVVHLIVDRRSTEHEAADGRPRFDDRMAHPSGKATELAHLEDDPLWTEPQCDTRSLSTRRRSIVSFDSGECPPPVPTSLCVAGNGGVRSER